MKKQGANRGATTAFLISTPESGVDSIALTYALLDPIMTIIRPLSAFLTAMMAGLLENFTGSVKTVEPEPKRILPMIGGISQASPSLDRSVSFLEKLRGGLRYGAVDVWGDIVVWFFVGIILAGAITALVPEALMARWLGGGVGSMLLMLVAGVPLYICATASTPIAAALILKGVSPGAALVFLLAGPATNITSLSVLFGILGKKGTFRYLVVIAVMALLCGMALDAVYRMLAISPVAVMGKASELLPHWVKFCAVLVLLGITGNVLLLRLKKRMAK